MGYLHVYRNKYRKLVLEETKYILACRGNIAHTNSAMMIFRASIMIFGIFPQQ